MLSTIAIISYQWILAAAAVRYLFYRYKVEPPFSRVFAEHRLASILTVMLFVAFSAAAAAAQNRAEDQLALLMRWSTLFWGLYLLSVTDIKEKKIPNQVILALLITRLLFFAYEFLSAREVGIIVAAGPLMGAAMAASIMLVAMLVSRHGIGMGDVKLFLVIGAYVGHYEIVSVLFLTVFFSAVSSVILLLTKKARLQDSIPMAPFAFAGFTVKFFLLFLGGE